MDNMKEILHNYFIAWNESFISKNGSQIREFMSKSFVGYWAHSNIDQPDPYYYDYDLEGSLRQMDYAEKSFEVFSITPRNNGNEYLISGREPMSSMGNHIWLNVCLSGEKEVLRGNS